MGAVDDASFVNANLRLSNSLRSKFEMILLEHCNQNMYEVGKSSWKNPIQVGKIGDENKHLNVQNPSYQLYEFFPILLFPISPLTFLLSVFV